MKVLVLNMDYSPINVTSLQRGFKLVFKGKAEIISHEEKKPITTEKKNYKRPTVIRLLRYISVPFRKVRLNRQNVFRRDDFKCVYCDSKNNLTLDHLIPKCKGGQNIWSNLITSCGKCNIKKGDKDVETFLEENNLKMSHQPFKPTYLYFVEKINNVNSDWKRFVGIVKK
jgi:5-methylcytosine-specific restriction endonuclease McrA